MNINNVNHLINFVIQLLENQPNRTEKDIDTAIDKMRSAFTNLTVTEFEFARKTIMTRLSVSINLGITIIDTDYLPWYSQRRSAIDSTYWNRYQKYLEQQGLSSKVVQILDQNTTRMLDLFGNPFNQHLSWKRRGLVMGDVQSGKTSNYIGLACKAADSGYKLIIILAGTIEALRKQTQERLDTGFVGIDSSQFLSEQKQAVHVGVGLIDKSITPVVLTSVSRDFSSDLVKRLRLGLNDLSKPLLVVIKKNKSILENFNQWISQNHTTPINAPVLIIDDEADNASINVRDSNVNPTEINKQIRTILTKFNQSTYVGFTATPFANIFISPNDYSEAYGDDLFPKDFIYSLEPPSNYTGTNSILEMESSIIRSSDDADDDVPLYHTRNLEVKKLPNSLINAIHSFFITTTIRDLTNSINGHRSMLINVSRFIDVQNRVFDLVNTYVYEMIQDIRNYSKTISALSHARITKLKHTFDTDFANSLEHEITWPQVLNHLETSTGSIETVVVHSQSTRALNYSQYKNDPRGYRVIVIGGNAISRGITLEGLSTSYFHRQSLQYDTLLQMGRWFGYREGYQHLCRIWMPERTESHFAHISSAVAELRKDLRIMYDIGARPYDFGLRVRTHPDLLLITARNKMRHAQNVDVLIDFSSRAIETPYLSKNHAELQSNYSVTKTFLHSLIQSKNQDSISNQKTDGVIWNNIYPSTVADYLKQLQIHKRNEAFIDNNIIKFITNNQIPELRIWDIAVANGSGDKLNIIDNQFQIEQSLRQIIVSDQSGNKFNWLQVSSRRKVGSGNSITLGLSEAEKARAQELKQQDTTGTSIREYYAEVRTRPILIIYFIEPIDNDNNKSIISQYTTVPLVALSINFPKYQSNTINYVTYAFNQVKLNQLGLDLEDTDNEDEDM